MDDPVKEIEDVVRSLTEPDEARIMAQNVEKYFTRDAYIVYPILKLCKHNPRGRSHLQGLYKWLRVITIHNKIEFHHVMWSEDRLHATIELTEHYEPHLLPSLAYSKIRFITRIDLRREEDQKYRIYRQQDNYPTDLADLELFPRLGVVSDVIKYTVGFFASRIGQFFLAKNIFGK